DAMVVVPEGRTLTIEPGASIHFKPRAGLVVKGTLIAVGRKENAIVFSRDSGRDKDLWAGIRFVDSRASNRIVHAHINFAGSSGHYIDLEQSNLTLEHCVFAGAERSVLRVNQVSLTVRNCYFPSVGRHEVIYGDGIVEGGSFLIENNSFQPNWGYKDIIDFSGCKLPGPIPVFRGNLFYGGGDDGIDLDGCDARIEDNVFFDFKRKGHDHFSNAVSISKTSRVVMVNNLFARNDHGVLAGGFSTLIASNNTFYGHRMAAITFSEKGHPTGGAIIHRSVFEGNAATFLHAADARQLEVKHSLLPEAGQLAGQGNVHQPDALVNPADNNFDLKPSPPLENLGPDLSRLPAY
ncbi:MAG: right-handed parallel beta-helix repeat-containing protein, partial [Verrucomicrobiota bacterium]